MLYECSDEQAEGHHIAARRSIWVSYRRGLRPCFGVFGVFGDLFRLRRRIVLRAMGIVAAGHVLLWQQSSIHVPREICRERD